MTRGPHKSTYKHQDFLQNEMADMIRHQLWIILPYDEVKDLRLSPIGVVPWRD